MSDRLDNLRKIFPAWQEDANGSPVFNTVELVTLMHEWAKELDADAPAPTVNQVKLALMSYAKLHNLKQPVFVERDK